MKLKTTHFTFLLTAILIFGFFIIRFYHKSADVQKILKNLPTEDRESLEWFFRGFQQDSSYVLFGNKPMSFCSMQKVDPYTPNISNVYYFMDSIRRLYLGNLVRINGWKAWGKYKHLFPSSNFIFLENNDDNDVTIFLINKNLFLKKVEENIDYFANVLGNNINPRKILNNCLGSKDMFRDALKSHSGLFGILLGFGRHNAQLFWKRDQVDRIGQSQRFSLTKKTPSLGFSTIEEEYTFIDSMLTAFSELECNDFNPLLLSLPGFVVDGGHLETQQLKIEYTKQYKNIIRKYKNADFLETTLRQFCDS